MKRSALFYLSLVVFPALFAFSQAQEPKPQDPNDKRGLGIQSSSPSPTPSLNSTQPKSPGGKPEIVLQAGITSPQTQLAFSPDGRLLASMGMMGNSIKLWEVSTGRLLRQLESSIPNIGSSSLSRPFRFSNDGRTIVAVADGRVRRWNVETGQELNNTLLPSAKNLTIALMSDDSSTLAALNMDSSAVRLWDLNSGSELRPITFDESENLTAQDSIALSPDGKQLAAMTSRYEGKMKGFKGSMVLKQQVTIWDVASGRKNQTITVSSSQAQLVVGQVGSTPVANIEFSPDGSWLALRSPDKIKIWESATGKEIKDLNTPTNSGGDPALSTLANRFLFSPDKQTLAVVLNNNTLSLIDSSSTSAARSLKGHQAPIVGFSFSRDGKLLASSGMDNKIKMWDVATANELNYFSGATMPITDVAFSRDGKSLALAGQQAVTYWELTTGGVRRAVAFSEDYSRTAQFGMVDHSSVLSPDARLMLVGSHTDPSVKIWDVGTGKESGNISLAEGKTLGNAVFNSDGRLYAVIENNIKQTAATNDATATPTPSPTPQKMPAGMPPGMSMPAGMPDMSKIMERMKKDPKGVQAEMKKAQEAMEKGDLSAGMSVMESLGLTPPSASKNKTPSSLRIVEAASGRQINTIPLPGGFLNDLMANAASSSSALSFSPDGHVLASASGYGAPVQLIDVNSGQVLLQLKTPFSLGVNALAWSPDGKQLASTQWAMKKGFTPADTNQSFSFEDMSFSIKLWDPSSGAELKTLAGHDNFVMKLAFSPDGRVLASGSTDSTIKLWDVQTGSELRTLHGHSGSITALDFSPDGRFIVSGSDDGSARLWKAQSGELLATLASLNGGNDWLVVTPSGLFDGSPRGWNQILWRFSPTISDVSPVESFFNEYFHPGLLTDILEGKQLAVAEDISQKDRRQPKLTLFAGDDRKVSTRTIKLTINVADAPAGAQDLRLFRNGSLVKLWRGDVLKGQPRVSIDTTVSVVAGSNEFRAYAFNHDNVKSTDATLTLDGANSLKRGGTLHLLVTGINEYANPEYNLKYAAADASSFAQEVERQQRKLNQYQQIEVTTLLDKNATKANLLYALNRLAGVRDAVKPAGAPAELDSMTAAQPEDAVILYFAGHGTAQQQRFFLIPHDIGYQGKRTELDRAGLESILSHGVSDLELEQAFVGIDAGVMLMVIDACNSGQALEAEEKRRGPMNSKGLAQLAYEKGIYILTAAQSYQAALEASQLGHGYLTYALVEEGLKTAAADNQPRDGEVQLREWLDYATERVPQMQQEKMHEARGLKIEIAFVEGEEKVADVDKRKLQRPRVFYRREQEAQPVIVAKP